MIALLALLSCQADPPATVEGTTPATEDAVLVPLDGPRLLRRISLDLRGRLPEAEALAAVEADPSLVDTYTEQWLASPELEERLVDLLAERFQTRLGVFQSRWFDFGLDQDEEFAFERAVADEPLRVVARVIVDDLPWSEIVTADWTMANPMLEQVWPLQREEGEGWQVATYTDGRPAAGLLATNGLWWRYVTTPSNKNRSRAAAILRLFACDDILDQPITFSSASDLSTSPDEMIWENEGCVSCHQTVDPLAASMFGFYWLMEYSEAEMVEYHPEREPLGPEILGVDPAWGDTLVSDLADLGRAIAEDSRFRWCAAETVAGLAWRREVDPALDYGEIEPLLDAYDQSGGRMRPVFAAALAGATYRAGGLADGADDQAADREMTVRMLSPDLLHDAVADITGFSWWYQGFDQLGNDELGFRVLAGGVDGDAVTRPQRDPGLTWALVTKRFAEAAADHAVNQAAAGAPPPLLDGVDVGSPPGRDQLGELYWRLLARRPDAAWLDAAQDLVAAADQAAGPQAAWTAALVVLLRDPDFVSL